MNPCENCMQPLNVKQTLGCYIDKLGNSLEDLKQEVFNSVYIPYKPEYNCRYSCLIKHQGEIKK